MNESRFEGFVPEEVEFLIELERINEYNSISFSRRELTHLIGLIFGIQIPVNKNFKK